MKPFRQNVCAVLVNEERSRVLVFHRVGETLPSHRWQFPQGGLHADESPVEGLRRELEEEIGTADVELLGQARRPIRYEYPPDVARKLKAEGSKLARYRGQEQHWFLARLRSGTAPIHFDHQPREFDAFRWVTPLRAMALVVPFKREAYRKGLEALGLVERESTVPGRRPGRASSAKTRAPGGRKVRAPGARKARAPR